MSFDADLHVLYKITNAPINRYPFPHIYVRDIFPPAYYRALRDHLPPEDLFTTPASLKRVVDEYPDSRLLLPLTSQNLAGLPEPYGAFWKQMASWMLGGEFGRAILPKFTEFLNLRFGDMGRMKFFDEALIVKDCTTYVLGPHTDNLRKVLSLLYYLPADDSLEHLGTSIYVPKDPDFRSTTGEHYPFDAFVRMITMPYLPNTLFAFVRTDNSFHGVEPVTDPNIRRELLLYDIKVVNPPELARQEPDVQPAAAKPAVHFTF
ncbi:MAG: hypothetical protein HYY78_15085 [Betaproteobacteria bacterium]|nr:hypothetical protein [Betaproteobacteria bacterium]